MNAQNPTPKIVAVHLLNDYSGSPLVFSQILAGLATKGCQVDLYTAGKRRGFLSKLPGVEHRTYSYQWSGNRWVTLVNYLSSQVLLFFILLRYWNQPVKVYVNTVLPFGAALAARLMGKEVIYHIHETSLKPWLLKWFLFELASLCGHRSIYVSKFIAHEEPLPGRQHMLYNALPVSFEKIAKEAPIPQRQTALMLCSLKRYKGVDEFVALAAANPGIPFELVLNSTEEEIGAYFAERQLPDNLTWYPAQEDVRPFYERARVLLNLSLPDQWVETFGMTALEAMSYGVPCIVPPVGGIAELVQEGQTGYQVDSRRLPTLNERIDELFGNNTRYQQLSLNCRQFAQRFSSHRLVNDVYEVLFLI